MTHISNNNKKTEQAWNTLYTRLEREELLPVSKPAQPSYSVNIHWGKWVAAIAILFISITTTYYLTTPSHPGAATMLSLHNQEVETTLITTLEDGSTIYLADNARIDYPEFFSSEKREVTLQGNAFFEVTGNPERPFIIEAGETEIEVIGTAFYVKNIDKAPFELSVQQGKVKVTSKKSGQVKQVIAGEVVQFTSSGLEVHPTLKDKQFQPYTNRVQFKDVPLSEVLRVINNKNPKNRIEASPSLKDRRLTVAFYNETPEEITELICSGLNLQYTRDKEILLISEQ